MQYHSISDHITMNLSVQNTVNLTTLLWMYWIMIVLATTHMWMIMFCNLYIILMTKNCSLMKIQYETKYSHWNLFWNWFVSITDVCLMHIGPGSKVHGANLGADRTHVGPMWAPWTLLSGGHCLIMNSFSWQTACMCTRTSSKERHRLIGIGIPIINLRRSDDRLRFIMGIPIPIRRCH